MQKTAKYATRLRQIQYIGALMRHIDLQPIESALECMRSEKLRK